jgi:hypothetical protein
MMDGVLSASLNDLSEGGELDFNNENSKLSKKIKSLQSVALTCATILGKTNLPLFHEIGDLLSPPPAEGLKKKNKKDEILDVEILPFDVVCRSLARALSDDDSEVNYQTLHRIGTRFVYEFKGLLMDRMKAVAFISLLDKVSLYINENKEVNQRALQNTLSLSSTLIINYIKISDINNTSIPDNIITALSNAIQRSSVSGLSGSGLQPNTITDLISEGVKGLSSDDMGGRILITLLSSTSTAAVSLISQCLRSFYITNPTLILLKIVLSASTNNDVKVTDLNMYTPLSKNTSVLYITPYARAGALMALSQFIVAINSINDMNSIQSNLLIVLLPVLIASCCDEDGIIRRAGLTLAQSFKQLRPVIKLNQITDKVDKLSVNVSVNDLNILGTLLHNAEGTFLICIYIYIYVYIHIIDHM